MSLEVSYDLDLLSSESSPGHGRTAPGLNPRAEPSPALTQYYPIAAFVAVAPEMGLP
ncbi:hypothetical protein BN77_p2190027 [Rhizobium mesoamericanum STM3625]|uniref:Uncharacterized protein n=1 Tax=Rhizobium mesoamericanum STM3625 TaxID=1211777 RepID=K0Q1F4_9HYPH|nr:hypothetical protein BN77_p2190027 [Rhizobium mesoamericanum STM3625]